MANTSQTIVVSNIVNAGDTLLNAVEKMNKDVITFKEVIENSNNAWQSANANKVRNAMNNISTSTDSIMNSLNNVRANIVKYAKDMETIDTVNINQ